MDKRRATLISLVLLGTLLALAIHFFSPRNEIHVRDSKRSSDGKWTAVVQLEVYNVAGAASDAVYAVRLKGPAQKDREGDLVMNVPVNYPEPEPSIEWANGDLIVTLASHQKYQYFTTPVSGVAITVQQK